MRALEYWAIGLLAAASWTTPAQSNDLSPQWDTSRATYIPVYQSACEGNAEAFSDLSAAAWDGADPVALQLLAVALIRGGACVPSAPFDSDREIRTASELSAEAGYPPGMFSHALNLLSGDFGTAIDVADGLNWLQTAMQEGSSRAAEELADINLDGDYGQPRDIALARQLMQRAERLGLSDRRLATLTTAVENATAQAGSSAAPPAAPAPAAEGSGEVIYSFETRTITTDDFPELGPIQASLGPAFAARVVYIAQLFDVGFPGCWEAIRVFLIGTRVSIADPGLANPRSFPNLLYATQVAIDRQDYANAFWFEDFNEGVSFREANTGRHGTNLSDLVLTMA